MQSITSVFDRISSIQSRFNKLFYKNQPVQTKDSKSFQDILSEKVSKKEDALTVEISSKAKAKYGKYDASIKNASSRYGVPESLLYSVIKQESGFDPNAVSSKGAMGLMQLMPATAKDLNVDNPFSPSENIMGGANYLSQMLTKYDGDMVKALAAYNAGPESIKGGNIPNYPETKNYVKKVMQEYLKNSGVNQ